MMLKELWLLLKSCDIFSVFTAMKVVEGKVLTSLGSAKAITGKAGLMVEPCALLTTF